MSAMFIHWWAFLGLLTLEIAVIALVGRQIQRRTKSALWRRTIGQGCILSLSLLAVFEFTGTAGDLAAWAGKGNKSSAGTENFLTQSRTSQMADGARGAVRPVEIKETPRASIVPVPIGAAEELLDPKIERETLEASGPPANETAVQNNISHRNSPWETILVLGPGLLWLAGTVAVLGRILFSRIALEIFRWRRRRVSDGELRETVQELAGRLGLKRGVRLVESEEICGPVAFGILRPTIGLPAQFVGRFEPAQREAMLVHELAHLAGHDPAWYLLADLLAAALWWHPAIWWARHRLHSESELAADEASLLVANGPNILAECLVKIGGRLTQKRAFAQMGIEGNAFRSGLGRRVERLVSLEGNRWRPPSPLKCGLARTFGPLALVTATILCSAWVIPPALTKGDSMNIMKQSWKQPLAAITLLATFGHAEPQPAALAASTAENAPVVAAAPGAAIAPEAPNAFPPTPATQVAPVPPAAPARALPGASAAVAVSVPPGATMPDITPPSQVGAVSRGRSSGPVLASGSMPVPATQSPELNSVERGAIESKLNSIMVDAVVYDNLPLSEVVNQLVEIAQAQDSRKVGINFVLNRETKPPSNDGPIDPTTGLPVVPETVDLAAVTIKINPALKHVRLIDVLNVIEKGADQPIKYSIEDYGVVFSPDWSKRQPQIPVPAFQQLEVRTFKIDTNTFFAGLDHAFGIRQNVFSGTGVIPDAQGSLKALMAKLGIKMDEPNKSVFYNDVTGIIMVRATSQDLAVVTAAMETLGGGATALSGIFVGSGIGSAAK